MATLRNNNQDANPERTIAVAGGDHTIRSVSEEPVTSTIHTFDGTIRTVRGETQYAGFDPSSEAFLLKGVRYRKIECLSDSSGEAQVFLVENGGQEYVLKVYYPNFDINKKLLLTIRTFDFEMIVKLYDVGKTYVEGKHRYYELMEYLKGDTLNHFNIDGDLNKFRRIALQGAAALEYCHNNNILYFITLIYIDKLFFIYRCIN